MSSDAALQARTNMVDCQIRPNRVYNPGVLQAMLVLPRENYVPAALKAVAYTDEALRIGPNRFILEPLVTARLFETAAIARQEHVLIVGSGTGYTVAIAAQLGVSVVALEEDDSLTVNEGALPAGTTEVKGKLVDGWDAGAPYDVILVDGAVAAAPTRLLAQLKPSGRLVTVLREPGAASHIVIYERNASTVSHRVVFDNVAPLLPGFEARQEFMLA